jgi:hypothetical protein
MDELIQSNPLAGLAGRGGCGGPLAPGTEEDEDEEEWVAEGDVDEDDDFSSLQR